MLLMTTMIYKWLLKHLWLIFTKKTNFNYSWLGLPFLGSLEFDFCQSANSAYWLIACANALETCYRVISNSLSIKYCIKCCPEMNYKAKVFPWEYTFHVNLAISQNITLFYKVMYYWKIKLFFYPEMALMAPQGENQLLCSTLCSSFEQEF